MERAHIVDAEWPVATRHELASIERSVAIEGEEAVNPKILALVRARKALGDARIFLFHARRLYTGKPEVKQRIDELLDHVNTAQLRFPLTILEGVKDRPRPKIFKQHEGMC